MKIYLLMISIFITGCVSSPVIYNPNNLTSAKLVKVTTSQKASLFKAGYNTWIEFVWNESEEEITKRNAFWDSMLGEITLPEGKYKFRVSCVDGRREAHPEGVFELVSKKNYQIYCAIRKGKNIFGMTIDAYASLKIREVK